VKPLALVAEEIEEGGRRGYHLLTPLSLSLTHTHTLTHSLTHGANRGTTNPVPAVLQPANRRVS